MSLNQLWRSKLAFLEKDSSCCVVKTAEGGSTQCVGERQRNASNRNCLKSLLDPKFLLPKVASKLWV